MCGIFGLILGTSHGWAKAEIFETVEHLFQISETRGREAAGLALVTGDTVHVIKAALSASEFLKSKDYRQWMARTKAALPDGQPLALLGHARLVTNGFQAMEANNQPTWNNGATVVHNGIVVNDAELWEQHPSLTRSAQVDTEVIAALLAHYTESLGSLEAGLAKTFALTKGEASIAATLDRDNRIVLATNTGSLYTARTESGSALAFLSEEPMIRTLVGARTPVKAFAGSPFRQLPPGHGALVAIENPVLEPFGLKAPPAPQVSSTLAVGRKLESQATRLEEKRTGMRRCSKCLMPETMPYIRFNDHGVCNYCEAYRPKVLKGRDALESELDEIRSKDGRPDCIVAFSGGRDSSYGLHLLRTEFDMTPIAYTYDWGMVTDIARRNQARICGQLEVEHLWVSADIKAKRRNIRNNVKAWLNRPNLGMIPLFMAGDKQFFWYANKLQQDTGIKKVIFCQNDYERTDFKAGFAGVPPEMEGRYYRLQALNLARLAAYYGGQYLLNPGYLNRSIFDTLFAYASYYFIKQDYLYLFDYIPWEEETLNRTLLEEYEWETAADTPTTWRIGDGTAAFYNYAYHTVAGFTENESFRSNQIRAGVLDRETAAALVEKENKPRWPSIREYLSMIGVDIELAIRAIDGMPKLYDLDG